MRLRLGLLQDPVAIEKQIAREAAEAQARKHKLEAPTVRTEAEQKAYEQETEDEKKRIKEKSKPRIRPLSEAKAIDAGANFVSEGFLFLVGVGLVVNELWRKERKETTRREDVAERISELEETERTSRRALVDLEKEILRLRAKAGEPKPAKGRILPKELWDEQQEEGDEPQRPKGWLSWIPWLGSKQVPEESQRQGAQSTTPPPSETSTDIEGSVTTQRAPSIPPKPSVDDSASKAQTAEKPPAGYNKK